VAKLNHVTEKIRVFQARRDGRDFARVPGKAVVGNTESLDHVGAEVLILLDVFVRIRLREQPRLGRPVAAPVEINAKGFDNCPVALRRRFASLAASGATGQ
jgi:hypothetical protein